MAVKGFEYYGQTVAPAAPQPTMSQPQLVQPTASAQAAPALGHAAARTLEAMVSLFGFAGALLAAGLIVKLTPLRDVDADITVPFVVLVLAVAAVIVARAVRR